MSQKKEIVILGASYSGVLAVKELFKQISDNTVHVTVVSTSTHSYFNIAVPRLISKPEYIDKAFFSLPKMMKKRSPTENYKFITGMAKSVDFDAKKVKIDTEEDGNTTLNYDFLVICTGTRCEIPAFKLYTSKDEAVDSIMELHKKVKQSKTIAILGAGPTGIELAGEIADFFGKGRKITIFNNKALPLKSLGEEISESTIRKLKEFDVEVINNAGYIESAEKSGLNMKKVMFEDGSSKNFDLVIPTAKSVPNSSFIPKKVLNSKGYLKTDKYFRVKGYKDVVGLGDILSLTPSSVVDIYHNQIKIFSAYAKKEIFRDKHTSFKSYEKPRLTIVIPISKSGGVGILLGFSCPSFLVAFSKGRDYLLSRAKTIFT